MENNEQISYETKVANAAYALNQLSEMCHNNARSKGFWKKHDDICDVLEQVDDEDTQGDRLVTDYKHTFFAQRLALIHSEVSEALEGDRKDLMDDKLPQYKMQDVELADAIIRIFDLAGGLGINLGEIVAAKMGYNATREYLHGKKY